jgi:hypothetical protein
MNDAKPGRRDLLLETSRRPAHALISSSFQRRRSRRRGRSKKKNTGCGAADPSSLSSLSLPLRAGVAPRSRSSLALAALKPHSRAGCWSRCSILSPAAGRSTTTMPTASRGALHVKHCARLLIPEIDAPIPLDSILPIKSVCMITDVKLMNLIAAVDCSADFSIPNFAILFVIPMF